MLNQKERGQYLATSYYFCSPTSCEDDVEENVDGVMREM